MTLPNPFEEGIKDVAMYLGYAEKLLRIIPDVVKNHPNINNDWRFNQFIDKCGIKSDYVVLREFHTDVHQLFRRKTDQGRFFRDFKELNTCIIMSKESDVCLFDFMSDLLNYINNIISSISREFHNHVYKMHNVMQEKGCSDENITKFVQLSDEACLDGTALFWIVAKTLYSWDITDYNMNVHVEDLIP